MSPEQARAAKDIDFRADIYSLALHPLSHAQPGRPPYEATTTLGIMMRPDQRSAARDLQGVAAGARRPCGRLVHRMLAKETHQRHQSYEELLAELMAVHDKLKADAEEVQAGSNSIDS